jgi:hypothetical protein
MQALVAVVILAVLAAVIVPAARYSLRKERELADAWRTFAQRRGFRWFGVSGPWYRRRSHRVEGELEGVPFVLDRYTVSTGKTSVRFTRVTAQLSRPARERVITCRRTWNGRLSTAFKGPIVELGDRRYDERMLVRCRSAHDARQALDATVRQRILASPRSLYVECRDGGAKVCWRGSEADPSALERGIAVASAIGVATARA